MVCIIGFAGLTGAGKTTAIRYLEASSAGKSVYLGKAVLDRMQEAGIQPSADGERVAREQLRRMYGSACLVLANSEKIDRLLLSGTSVLIDAIFHRDELTELRRHADSNPMIVVGLTASFDTRCGRLSTRTPRPLTKEQVKARDDFELNQLGIGAIISAATYTISNEGSLDDLESALNSLMKVL
jgi:dephospho-CoA kinase